MIVSFGYLHGPAPRADLTLDVRNSLRDPARMSDDLRDSTGLDPRVQQVVWTTKGARDRAALLVAYARQHPDDTIAVGCAGGRHRSVAIAEYVAAETGHEVRHLHVHLPRVLKPGRGE